MQAVIGSCLPMIVNAIKPDFARVCVDRGRGDGHNFAVKRVMNDDIEQARAIVGRLPLANAQGTTWLLNHDTGTSDAALRAATPGSSGCAGRNFLEDKLAK